MVSVRTTIGGWFTIKRIKSNRLGQQILGGGKGWKNLKRKTNPTGSAPIPDRS
jgi:hypothetical protein